MWQRQRDLGFLSTAELEFVDPTVDDHCHLAIAHQLRRLTVRSSLLWLAGSGTLHNSYSGIHDALLGFVNNDKQGTCHCSDTVIKRNGPFVYGKVKSDGIVGARRAEMPEGGEILESEAEFDLRQKSDRIESRDRCRSLGCGGY